MTSCALCLRSQPLRNSHIYPEWIYEPLYDDKHRFEILSLLPAEKNKFRQQGIRQQLLCDNCEQKISVWEGYAKSIFVQPNQPIEYRREESMIEVLDLDYNKLKLFELSILWRAGVSNLLFFSKVNLGDTHSEILRRQLVASDPGHPDRYGAFMYGLKVGEKAETLQLIMEPLPIRSFGLRAYRFIFGGFLWIFHVANSDPPILARRAFLQEDGSRMICVKNALEMQYLFAFAQKLNQMGRAPRLQLPSLI